jgi:hypothetical protein
MPVLARSASMVWTVDFDHALKRRAPKASHTSREQMLAANPEAFE